MYDECNWSIFSSIKCAVCKKEIKGDSVPIHSYTQVTKWGTRTCAVCDPCKESRHEEWIKNGWELVNGS